MNSKTSIDVKNGKVNFECRHNPKAFIAYCLIKFKTSEDELLSEILRKFKNDKFIGFGTNLNNKCQMIKTNVYSIYITIPEGKIFQFIALLYRYLMNSDISSVAINSCLTKNQSYTKLHSDLEKGFDVYITGKCKNICNKIHEKHKSIKNLSTILKSTPIKKREDITIDKSKVKAWYNTYKLDGSFETKLYFCIFYQNYDFHFSSGSEIMINEDVYEEMKYHMKENKKLVQGYIKAYLSQMGSLASKPSANDKGGEKMKLRNKLIMENINMMINMLCEFYNLKPSEISSLTLNQKALSDLKKNNLK